MSEFDNNGYQNAPGYDNVNDPQVVDNGGYYDGTQSGSYDGGQAYGAAPDYDQNYNGAPDYNAAPDYGYDNAQQYGAPQQGESKMFAIISLVCGIVSLVCSCCGYLPMATGVAAVVLGILSLNKENAKGMAIAGIICGGLGAVIGIVVAIMGSAISATDATQLEDLFDKLEDI